MKPEAFINKIQPDPEGLDFKGFREAGIKAAQELSGDIWTDYNLHDPGVTILEALSYALTDLVYRAGFDAEDYLASGNGKIEFDKLGLFLPNEILSCRPLTDNDYRKLILDSIPDADNVWIERHTEKVGEIPGLCHISVLLGEQVKDQCNGDARRKYAAAAEKVYAANRNLCEDLAGVRIVDRQQYSLEGEIEIDGKRDPANILAEILFEGEQYLCPQVAFHSYPEMHRDGSSLETLFTGALTGNGYIAEDEMPAWCGQFSIPELVGKISRIEGVKNIERLHFVGRDEKPIEYIELGSELACRIVACLKPPSSGIGGIRLHRTDKNIIISQQDVEREYTRLDYESHALKYQKNRFDWVEAMLPSVTPQNIGEYYSIQNHFPAVYGINAYGVPDSYPEKRKAQAMQLKAYLLLFEQIMANFLQNAQEIKRLFSLDERLDRTYFFQTLQNVEVPKAELLYGGGIGKMVPRHLAQFDNFGDRRNRVLDYLLGIYGETFSQHSLRYFFAEETESANALIKNKLAFLKNIADIGKNRAAAFDYRRPSDGDDNCSGLKNKLKLLLGLLPGETAPGANILGDINHVRDSIQIVEHILLRPVGNAAHHGHEASEFYGLKASIIFHSLPDQPTSKEFQKLAEETVYINCPAHIHAEIFWLEPVRMSEFNELHQKWLTAKRDPNPVAGGVNAAAERLTGFLTRIRGARSG